MLIESVGSGVAVAQQKNNVGAFRGRKITPNSTSRKMDFLFQTISSTLSKTFSYQLICTRNVKITVGNVVSFPFKCVAYAFLALAAAFALVVLTVAQVVAHTVPYVLGGAGFTAGVVGTLWLLDNAGIII